MTEAPYSASVRPIAGPAIMRQSSRTRMPARTWGLVIAPDGLMLSGNGAGGEASWRGLISNGGSLSSVRP